MLGILSAVLCNPAQAPGDHCLFLIDHSSAQDSCSLQPSSGPRDQRPLRRQVRPTSVTQPRDRAPHTERLRGIYRRVPQQWLTIRDTTALPARIRGNPIENRNRAGGR
jgi:hypothetical protein